MRRLGTPGVIVGSVLLLATAVWLARARVWSRTSASAPPTTSVAASAGGATRASTALLSREEESGRLVYERHCILCHGPDGDGFGINAPNLRVEPPALADPNRLSSEIDQHVADRIAQGGSARGLSDGCPPWSRRLGTGNIQAVVAYLRWLASVTPAGGLP